jgi:IS1 family transposase
MNVLSFEKRVAVIAALCEGMSIRATARLTDVNRETVGRLAMEVGAGCAEIHDQLMRGLNVGVLELDEIWSFIGAKKMHVKPEHPAYFGDCYVHTALAATSKAIVSYKVGRRDTATAMAFCADLRARIVNRPQITTDGHVPYIAAVEHAFGADVDFAQLVKHYEGDGAQQQDAAHRYSPGRIRAIEKYPVAGRPRLERVSTSFVERSNLQVRMQTRRFTRLTNAFSKKLDAHEAAVHLFVTWYNLCWVHSTIRMTPAMALGVTDSIWTVADLVRMALGDAARAA